jgi:hypothetical protein
MKKILLILFTLQFSLTFAQKELTFKVHYNPETNYNQTILQTSEMNLKYIGSEEILQKLKQQGIQNPTIMSSNSKNEMVLKTGKLSNKNSFPITMELINTTSNDEKKPMPDGTIIYGTGTIDDLPKLDSIVSKNIDENYKKALLQTLQSTFSQMSFPIKKLKIGDSFSQESPLSIPIAGVTIKMLITTTYKLLSITNNKGNLDVDITFSMDSNISKYNVKASGHGKGLMVYDMETQFISKYETETQMEMLLKTEKIDLEINSKSGYIQTVVVSKNRKLQ